MERAVEAAEPAVPQRGDLAVALGVPRPKLAGRGLAVAAGVLAVVGVAVAVGAVLAVLAVAGRVERGDLGLEHGGRLGEAAQGDEVLDQARAGLLVERIAGQRLAQVGLARFALAHAQPGRSGLGVERGGAHRVIDVGRVQLRDLGQLRHLVCLTQQVAELVVKLR